MAKDVPFDISGSPASHNLLSPRTDDLAQEPGPTSQQALANFHGTSLSTIKESPSVRGDLSTALEAAFPPQKVTRSTYELPFASDDARMLLRHSTPKREYRIQSITPTSSPSRESNVPLQEQYPFVPPRHGLAPSLSLTMDLTKSQIQRADRTQNEITQSHFAIDTMEAELYQARTSWGKANDATGSLLAELNGREVLVQRLEGQLAESKRACSDLVEETRAHANSQDIAPLILSCIDGCNSSDRSPSSFS